MFLAVSDLIPGVPFCVPLNPTSTFYSFWIPILVFETLMCTLALLRGYRSYKEHILRFNASEHATGHGSLILQILLRDSILYFMV